MGYCFTNRLDITCSDETCNFFSDLLEKMIILFKEQEKFCSNGFNTDGIINVAIVLNDFVLSNKFVNGMFDHKTYEYVKNFIERFEKYIIDESKRSDEDWDGKKNKKDHLRVYNKLLNSLRKKAKQME